MKKRYILLPILFVAVVVIFVSCRNIYKEFAGGPVEDNIRAEMTTQLTDYLKNHGYHGSVKLGEAEHFGFSRGGIDAEYTYTEKVNGKKVTVDGGLEATDDGDIDFDDQEVVDSVKYASLQQPKAKKYQKLAAKQFKKVSTKKMKFADAEMEMDLDYFSDDSKQWFENKIAANRQDKNVAFNGYYKLSIDELLKRNIAEYRIDYNYHVAKESSATDEKGHAMLDRMINKLNAKNLPDGQYLVGYEIVSNEGSSGSITDSKYLLIKAGKIIRTSDYGDDEFMDNDILILRNKKTA